MTAPHGLPPLILPPVALPADHKPVKAGQIGVIDGHALHGTRQRTKARAKDQPQAHRCRTRARPDQGGKLSAL